MITRIISNNKITILLISRKSKAIILHGKFTKSINFIFLLLLIYLEIAFLKKFSYYYY